MAIIWMINGAGATMPASWINSFCYWVLQLFLAWLTALSPGLGAASIFCSVFVADILAGIVGYLVFRYGRWRLDLL